MADFNVRFKFYADRAGVMRRLGTWRHAIFSRTGAYGRGVMKKQIRPALKSKKRRTVTVGGTQYLVPLKGMVIDARTNRPATKQQADAARLELSRKLRRQGEGKPPRSITGKLRNNIDFGIEGEAVTIGAYPFPKQPRMVGRVSVPELLNKGGGEYIGNQLVKYGPRPFVETVFEITRRKMGQFIEERPVQSVV